MHLPSCWLSKILYWGQDGHCQVPCPGLVLGGSGCGYQIPSNKANLESCLHVSVFSLIPDVLQLSPPEERASLKAPIFVGVCYSEPPVKLTLKIQNYKIITGSKLVTVMSGPEAAASWSDLHMAK